MVPTMSAVFGAFGGNRDRKLSIFAETSRQSSARPRNVTICVIISFEKGVAFGFFGGLRVGFGLFPSADGENHSIGGNSGFFVGFRPRAVGKLHLALCSLAWRKSGSLCECRPGGRPLPPRAMGLYHAPLTCESRPCYEGTQATGWSPTALSKLSHLRGPKPEPGLSLAGLHLCQLRVVGDEQVLPAQQSENLPGVRVHYGQFGVFQLREYGHHAG